MSTQAPVSDDNILEAWGVAELRGPSGTVAVERGLLSPQVLESVRADGGESLAADGWRQVRDTILVKRGPLIGNLFTLGIEWSLRAVTVDQLQALEIIAIPEWHAKYPTHRMDELAGARHLPGTAPEFRGFETACESPICVGASAEGPFCLVEGYTRVGTFLRDVLAGLTSERQMRMLVGVSPRIHEWAGPTGWRWWP